MFGFPKIKEKNFLEFKHNFLRSVALQIKFEKTDSLINDKSVLIENLSPSLPRFSEKKSQGFEISFSNENQTPILQSIPQNQSGFELKSHDGNKVLTVIDDTINYTISGISYKTFNDLKNDIDILQKYLSKNNVNVLNRISIRKINIINFKINEDSSDTYIDVLSNIINPNLLTNLSYFPQKSNINGNMNNLSCNNNDYGLNLIYGLAPTNTNNDFGNIVIDIDLFKHSILETNLMLKELYDINDEVFNIFNWSISDEAKNILKGI